MKPQPFRIENLLGMSGHDFRPMFMLYATPELQAIALSHPGIMESLSSQPECRVLLFINPRYDPEMVWLEIYYALEDVVKSGEYVELDKTVWGDI